MFADRRKALLDAMGEGVMILPAPPTFIRNNDVEHEYRQGSDLYYLTGFDEPDSVLVLSTCHPERAVLFLRTRDPERETWDGPRLGVERAPSALGIDAAYPIAALDERLPGYLENVRRVHYRLGLDRRFDDRVLAALDVVRTRARRSGAEYPSELVDPALLLHEMRLTKSADEIALMRKAAIITREAHLAAMRAARPGRYEYEVEAELLRTFRAHGSERPAYGSIVGAGPNATILHYRKNDRRLEEGDLLLIDAGAEFGYYASDVTRTFPVSGRFSEPQLAVYDVVLDAQLAAIEAVRPGATIEQIHETTVDRLVDGLLALGLLQGDKAQLVAQGDYKRFYMHRTSHWLGMDVHDVGRYHRAGAPRPLEPGFVLTVEPGLYIAPDAEVDPRYRGIGIRIEDDILVTPDGHQNLTYDIPKRAADLEALLSAR